MSIRERLGLAKFFSPADKGGGDKVNPPPGEDDIEVFAGELTPTPRELFARAGYLLELGDLVEITDTSEADLAAGHPDKEFALTLVIKEFEKSQSGPYFYGETRDGAIGRKIFLISLEGGSQKLRKL